MPTDYRDPYCGTYSCKKVRWNLNSDRTAVLIDTVTVNITISKNATDSILNVATQEGTFLVKLRSNTLIPNDSHPIYYGKTYTDSVVFNFRYSQAAPPYYKYYGKK
jgi:hypothetical protein